MLAVKFTALLALPLLLLATDAPWRAGWRWRRYGTATGVAAALAGPWYLRNLIAFGNPVFPVSILGLPGLFTTARAGGELRTVGGAWATVTGGYAGTTVPLAIGLLTVWVAAVASAGRAAWADPLARLCLIGPAFGIGLFLALSPYPEARFLLPTLGLLAASAGADLPSKPRRRLDRRGRIGGRRGGDRVRAKPDRDQPAVRRSFGGRDHGNLRGVAVGAASAGGRSPRSSQACSSRRRFTSSGRRRSTPIGRPQTVSWDSNYGELGAAWAAARDRTVAGSTVAYAGTHFTYPLAGFDLDRRGDLLPLPGRACGRWRSWGGWGGG